MDGTVAVRATDGFDLFGRTVWPGAVVSVGETIAVTGVNSTLVERQAARGFCATKKAAGQAAALSRPSAVRGRPGALQVRATLDRRGDQLEQVIHRLDVAASGDGARASSEPSGDRLPLLGPRLLLGDPGVIVPCGGPADDRPSLAHRPSSRW
jgi:hypothetical protein